MLREASFLTFIAEGGLPTSDHTAVMAALIGGVVAIVVALITGYFGTRGERARRTVDPWPDLRRQLDEAVLDAAHTENERRDIEDRLIAAEFRVDALERALVLRGFAPWRFITGEEDDDHARIAPR